MPTDHAIVTRLVGRQLGRFGLLAVRKNTILRHSPSSARRLAKVGHCELSHWDQDNACGLPSSVVSEA